MAASPKPPPRRVLVISYDFPPSPVGIWRTLKFCRYMPEFGWVPSILTVRPVRAPRIDWAPLEELPADTTVRRTGSLDPGRLAHLWRKLRSGRGEPGEEPSAVKIPPAAGRRAMELLRRWVFVPDERIGWLPFAFAIGRKWLKEESFDAIYSTSFPHTAHLVGSLLARDTGLPLLTDFRDSWTGNYEFFRPATPLHASIQHGLERFVIRSARRVVSATGPITADFQRRYYEEPEGKFLTITNGFDPGDFPKVTPRPDPARFTISYVGTMFGKTSPWTFFLAVRRLLRRNPQWRTKLRLRFVGSMIPRYRAMIERAGLAEITKVEDYLPHAEALRAMAEADALLLIVPDIRGSEIMLTQKVFEYAAARRPILGLVPQGAAREFLSELGEGPIVPPRDVEAVERTLEQMLGEWERTGRRELPPNPVLEKYHRRNLTSRLCETMDGMVRE